MITDLIWRISGVCDDIFCSFYKLIINGDAQVKIQKIEITEWISALSDFFVAILALLALIVAFQTKNEWKAEQKFVAFQSYYEKLEMKKQAAYGILTLINSVRDSKERYNAEEFSEFKDKLNEEHMKFMNISFSANGELFAFLMNKTTLNTKKRMKQSESEVNKLLKPLQNLYDEGNIKYKEINNAIQKDLAITNEVIMEAAKSIKNDDTQLKEL